MMPEMEGFEQELKTLKDAYAEQLPEKLAQMEVLWRGLIEQGWNEECFKAFHRMVHSMAGSAPVFGFTAVGRSARELEARLMAISASGAPLSDVDGKEFSSLMATIRASAQLLDD